MTSSTINSEDDSSDCERSSTASAELDLADADLATAHRGIMARTRQKYLVMDASSLTDRCFTGTLIVVTMVAILVLFWFQNFGPGFHFRFVKNKYENSESDQSDKE